MSDLNSVVALILNGHSVALTAVLQAWKVDGRLEQLLDQLVEERLIAETAQAEGVRVTDEELQAAANTFRTKQGLHKAADTQAWLTQHHLTVEDLQTRVEKPLLRRKLAEHLTANQIDRYFAEHRSDFDRARLSQIVVDKEGVAAELLSQIVDDGGDFAALARKHSLDPATKQAGGFLGVVSRRALASVVEAAVFGARAGDVVGPFKTAHGFCLVKVEEILPAQLDERTTETIRERLFAEWLKQRKARATVEQTLLSLV